MIKILSQHIQQKKAFQECYKYLKQKRQQKKKNNNDNIKKQNKLKQKVVKINNCDKNKRNVVSYQCLKNSYINRKMEDNIKIIQLLGLSNTQYLDQLKTILLTGQVIKISFFITFKQKLTNQQQKDQRKLFKKIYSGINSYKQKQNRYSLFNQFKNPFLLNQQQSIQLKEEIKNLYQSSQFNKLIQILIPKQQFFKQQIDQIIQSIQDNNIDNIHKIKQQYSSLTFHLGNCFFQLKNYDKAIQYYQKCSQQQPIRQRAQRMNNLGSCYAKKKSYPYALKFYKQAVKSYNQCQDQDVSNLLNNIALIYLKCQMFQQAQGFFKDAIQQRKLKSPNNKLMLYNSYFNLGVCQKKMQKLQQSLNNLVIAWNYAFQGHGKKIDVLTEICKVYQIQEKWCEALNHYQKLSQQYQNLSKPQGIIYQRVSKIHQKLGNTILAAKFAKQAYKIYQSTGDQRKLSELSHQRNKSVAIS